MITFKELRRRLNEVTIEQSIFDDLEDLLDLIEGTFYVYRTDTNAVLAKNIPDFEAAKERANKIRKSLNLKWDQVKFKAERGMRGSMGGSPTAVNKPFGMSRDGRTFTNASGETSSVDYAKRFNSSKERRFRGYTDSQGNYHDID